MKYVKLWASLASKEWEKERRKSFKKI